MQSFKISNSKIIHESIEDNTLIINLEVGHYFNLNSTGSATWKLLILGIPSNVTAEAISAHFQVGISQVTADISQFITKLKDEGILTENQIFESTQSIETQSLLSYTSKLYEAPDFIKYTDMEALLLADPVHEFINES